MTDLPKKETRMPAQGPQAGLENETRSVPLDRTGIIGLKHPVGETDFVFQLFLPK